MPKTTITQNELNQAEPATRISTSPYDRLHNIEEHIHSEVLCYPTAAAGTTITAGTPAWTLGNYSEIVPASTIGDSFDLHWINIEAVSADTTYEIVIYATTTEIARIRVTASGIANSAILPTVFIMTPIVPADTQIQAKLMSASGNADTITISIEYHTY